MSESKKQMEVVNDVGENCIQIRFFSSLNSDTIVWENLCKEINVTLKILSRNYIWHKDEFKVYMPIMACDQDDIPMHLASTVCFGDNIEDEWYIVHLVMELSKSYGDMIIQVVDSDGDFLLIEAANYLPLWANPESTINRVFIYKSKIHLIPSNLVDLKNEVKLRNALKIITNCWEQTAVSSEIHEAIQTRMGQYPQKIEENFHQAVVKVPLDIAALLTLHPALIAPIVTTYCDYYGSGIKSCEDLHFTDCIPVEVKFTKCLYAMLVHSKTMKHPQSNFVSKSNKRDTLGFKLTCGFHMIMKASQDDTISTQQYKTFVNNLKVNGYFKGNVENSLEYNQLLDKAKTYFLDVECPINMCVSKKISDLMTTHEFLDIKENFKLQNPQNKYLTEDNDDWLCINPNQLNDLLNNRYADHKKNDTQPETVTSKITDFLKQPSEFDGVDTNNIKDAETDCINFDAEEFENCLEKIVNYLSSDVKDIHFESSSETESENDDDVINDSELDNELAKNLNLFEDQRSDCKSVVFNLTQSIKEEGLSGPSSNLLTSIGITKTDLLDSDDDN